MNVDSIDLNLSYCVILSIEARGMGIWSSRHFFMNVLRCYSKTVVKKSDSFAVMVIFRWLGAVMNLSSCSMSVDAGMLRWVHAK